MGGKAKGQNITRILKMKFIFIGKPDPFGLEYNQKTPHEYAR